MSACNILTNEPLHIDHPRQVGPIVENGKAQHRLRAFLVHIHGLVLASLLFTSCATGPFPEEKLTLSDAIVGASGALTTAEREIRANKYRTFGLYPSKATVAFDLTTIRGNDQKLELAASLAGGIGAGATTGWSATRRLQKGSHIEIEFTPRK